MKQSKKAGRLKALSLFSIVLAVAIAGTASMASADGGFPSSAPNQFYGTITLNGNDAPVGTIVCAYIGGELRGSVAAGDPGKYGFDLNYLSVQGNDGDLMTFTVAGAPAAETIGWSAGSGGPTAPPRELDLTAEDQYQGSIPATGHTATAEPTEPEPSDESEATDESTTGDAEETATTETEGEAATDGEEIPTTDGEETSVTELKTNATPGFSAFLVVAGLLAAMYLVLRRRD